MKIESHWPAHIRKPDGKVNNLALGSDDAFQILGSVIRNQLHEFSNRSEKWLHIKNWVEYHHISHQAAKGKDKCIWWAHIHSVLFITSFIKKKLKDFLLPNRVLIYSRGKMNKSCKGRFFKNRAINVQICQPNIPVIPTGIFLFKVYNLIRPYIRNFWILKLLKWSH